MGTFLLLIMIVLEGIFFIGDVKCKAAHKKEKEYARIAIAVIFMILVLTGILDGFLRYGMLIVILGIQCVIQGIKLLIGRTGNYKTAKAIAVLVGNILLYAVCLTAAFVFPQHKDPAVTGNLQVATMMYTWTDESRIETFDTSGDYRKITFKIWYPTEEGSYPLVLFDHGAFGVIESNTSTCENLASNGYVVVSMGHPYHSMYIKDMDGKITIADQDFLNSVLNDNGSDDPEHEKEIYENSKEWIALRSGDNSFALDTILQQAAEGGGEPFDRINQEKTGLFGHSMGGAAVEYMGRTRDDIDVVIDLEGTMFGEYVGFADGRDIYNEEPYQVPILDVYSRDIYDQAAALTDVEYVNFYLGERASDYQVAVIEDAGHLNFTDLPVISPFLAGMLGTGDVDPRECIEQVNELVLDYFNQYLKE